VHCSQFQLSRSKVKVTCYQNSLQSLVRFIISHICLAAGLHRLLISSFQLLRGHTHTRARIYGQTKQCPLRSVSTFNTVRLEAGSESGGSAAADRVDWRLDVCTNPYAEVRDRTLPGGRRPLCPPPPRAVDDAGETLVFRSNSNTVQLVINRQRPTTTDRVDGGPYFLIRYDGTRCFVYYKTG